MFENIDKCAVVLLANGVKQGDIVSLYTLTIPEKVYLLYAVNKIGAVAHFFPVNYTKKILMSFLTMSKLNFFTCFSV